MAAINGTITRLVLDKGFGFISRVDADHHEYFFHQSALRGGALFETLREGQAVTFEEGISTKGLRAENVIVAGV